MVLKFYSFYNIEQFMYAYPEMKERFKKLQNDMVEILEGKNKIEDNIKYDTYKSVDFQNITQKHIKGDVVLNRVISIINAYEKRLENIENEIKEILFLDEMYNSVINKLNKYETKILHLRYTKNIEWKNIAKEMDMTIRNCTYIKEKMVVKFYKYCKEIIN